MIHRLVEVIRRNLQISFNSTVLPGSRPADSVSSPFNVFTDNPLDQIIIESPVATRFEAAGQLKRKGTIAYG